MRYGTKILASLLFLGIFLGFRQCRSHPAKGGVLVIPQKGVPIKDEQIQIQVAGASRSQIPTKTPLTPNPINLAPQADRIWGEVVTRVDNGVFDFKVFANGVCQLEPSPKGKMFLVREGVDVMRPEYGTNWPRGVAIKIRNKSGEILGMKSFPSGWMNPNWGGSSTYELKPEAKLVALDWYSDGLDLAALAAQLNSRIKFPASVSELEFKMKIIFLLGTELYQPDGTKVSEDDCKDFETDWLPGHYLQQNQ